MEHCGSETPQPANKFKMAADGWNYRRPNYPLMWPRMVMSYCFPCSYFCAENFVILFYEIKLLFTYLKKVLNSLRIGRIFTQHPTICEECGGSMKTDKGNGISRKLPPYIQKNTSGGREIAGMKLLFLVIYYHASLGSTRSDKEIQHKPIIFIKFSTLKCFRN